MQAELCVQSKPQSSTKHQPPPSALQSHPLGADKAARFKEEKHLKIETRDLGRSNRKPPGAEDVSSVSKKRRRRLAAEIDRKYKCPFAACQKAYGSEGSLIHHQKLKHPEQVDRREKESKIGTLVLPLHRNVTIRPATPLMAMANRPKLLLCDQRNNRGLHCPMAPSSDAPPAAKASRRSTRSRSNSEPVSVVSEKGNARVCTSNGKLMSKAYPKLPRKPRRVATTSHAMKTEATARRAKLRSKSESLADMNPFCQLDELSISMFDGSNGRATNHEAVLPFGNVVSSTEDASFDWPGDAVSASGNYTTTPSSDEQAIDSDILSVLASCDTVDPPMSHFTGGLPAAHSYQPRSDFDELDDTEMMSVGEDCFKIAGNVTLPIQASQQLVTNESEIDLGLNALSIMGDEWSNGLLLSDHLEKMSMAPGDTPPHITIPTFGNEAILSSGIGDRVRSASDPVRAVAPIYPQLHHVASMPLDAASVKLSSQLTGDTTLGGHQQSELQQWLPCYSVPEVAKVGNNVAHPMLLVASENASASSSLQPPSSDTLDRLLQYDDAVGWKSVDVYECDAVVDYALCDTEMTPTQF
ncbi:unnamed protein product [Hyaloperonospora brassicae]|uniref:C2H2-type domain-containing protein n=1 Tax=Hyaloperonospora brassicae TaxID=162125 RepID=A0AAV0UVB0_HYABA|nr:unnamed protein product [Hyaloperonospora brassicae]